VRSRILASCFLSSVRRNSVLEELRVNMSLVLLTLNDKNSSGDEIANVNFYAVRPEATEFAEITQNNAITPFKVIQGHRFWYQSKAHVRFPISD